MIELAHNTGEIGWQVGKLTMIDYAPSTDSGKRRGLFKCVCGNEKVIRFDKIKIGKTVSCGCHGKRLHKRFYESEAGAAFTESQMRDCYIYIADRQRLQCAGNATTYTLSAAAHLHRNKLAARTDRADIRKVATATGRGVQRAMKAFGLAKAEVLCINRIVKAEQAIQKATPKVAIMPLTPEQKTLASLLEQAQQAWLNIEDPELRKISLESLGNKIASGIERIAGKVVDVTSHANGTYGQNLNPVEFPTPGTAAFNTGTSALAWVYQMLAALPAEVLEAFGGQVKQLLQIMSRSLVAREARIAEMKAKLKNGVEVLKSGYRPVDRIGFAVPGGIAPSDAAVIVSYSTAQGQQLQIAA